MQVGDRTTEAIHMGAGATLTKTGTVIYIHPRRRFYVVEFEMGAGHRLQESYFFSGRGGDDETKTKAKS